MIATRITYEPKQHRGTRLEGIQRVKHFDVPKSYYPAIAMTVLLYIFMANIVMAWLLSGVAHAVVAVLLAAVNGVLIAGLCKGIMSGVPLQGAYANVRGISDEIDSIVTTYRQMLTLRSYSPEGTGMRERIDEYGRMAFRFIQECDRLPERTAGTHKNYYHVQSEIRNEAKKLIEAGDSLVDLVSSKRANSTLESLKFIGIDEYAEHLSLETMAHRALMSGDDEPKTKKVVVGGQIPARPTAKGKQAMKESFARVNSAKGKSQNELIAEILNEHDVPGIRRYLESRDPD